MLASLLLCVLALQEPQLKPARYASPSGRRELVVDPGGVEGATYRMRLDGEELWSVERPFLLRDAALAEDGRVAGWALKTADGGLSGTMFTVALSSTGEVLAQVPQPLTRVRGAHGGHLYFPRVEDVVLQPDLERFVFLVFAADAVDELGYEVWSHELATGARLTCWRPPKGELTDLLAVRAIPSTPLLLVAAQNVSHASAPARRDAHFLLLDAEGRSVWSLEIAHDHEVGGDWTAGLRQKQALHVTPPILAVLPGRFELRAVAAAQRILFAVESTDGTWRVRELERQALAQ